MAELLAHAEVNSGSFYHFFDRKKPCSALFSNNTSSAARPWSSIPLSPPPPRLLDRIFAILAGYRERIIATDTKYGCPLGRLALEIDPENALRTP